MGYGKKILVLSLVALAALGFIYAEDADAESRFSFGLGLELGAQTFNQEVDGAPGQITYQQLTLYPDFAYGKFGIGLAVNLHYRFTEDGLEIREEDWVPSGDISFLDLYLPIFRYIRYGFKGDPVYAKFGSIDDGSLGTGFVMGGYSNTLFLPERRIVGLAFDLDGSLFKFPYIGFETFTGNLAKFDVFGARLYARPLANFSLPLLPNLQLGSTFAFDREPDANYEFLADQTDSGSGYTPDTVTIFSFDLIQPILNKPALTLAAYTDLAFQPGNGEMNAGLLVGAGGRLIRFISYGLNVLFLGDNFVPFYFDTAYDLYRQDKYEVYSGITKTAKYSGWMASLGFGLFGDQLLFKTTMSGAFSRQEESPTTYPGLRSALIVEEGFLPGFFFDAFYDKRYIGYGESGEGKPFFEDLVNPVNAVIGAHINYRTGPAVLTLGYNLRYNPNPGPDGDTWETSAKLSTAISLF